MKARCYMRHFVLLMALVIGWSAHAASPDVREGPRRELGDAPQAPSPQLIQQLQFAAPPLALAIVPTGFSVTITNREAVRALFNTVYESSQQAAIDWTGDTATCVAGTTSATFRDLTALRINYFRAMAGVPADIVFDSTFNTKNQAGALMMSANDQLSHFPPATWTCYTADGAEAAENSNIGIGNTGPDAIDSYLQDKGANNAAVGHRRWLLYPQTETMGSGNVDEEDPFRSANTVWVFDGNFGGARPTTRDTFVSWPPPGFVPYQVVYPRWSFSYPAANFSSATVTLSTNGVTIPVTLETVTGNVGENTLVWYPSSLNPLETFQWPRPTTDTVYSVSVQNVVISSVPTAFQYTVKVFDPAVAGPDTVLPVISGSSTPTVNVATPYSFTTVPLAEGYEWRQARRATLTAVEGAENGLTFISTNVTPGYSVIVNSPVGSGSAAFHLAHPQAEDQILTYTRPLLPGAGSSLQFQSRLGFATTGQVATVQVSLDDGNSWNDIYNQVGTGGSGEGSFTTRNVSLTNYVDRSILVRFRYAHVGGSFYPQTTSGIGWYVDNITLSGTEELTQPVTTTINSGTAFDFTPTIATNFALLARADVFDAFHLEWGPAKRVGAVGTPTSNSPPVAICQAVVKAAGANCQAAVSAAEVDDGSSDPDGGNVLLSLNPAGPFNLGTTPVVLTATDTQSATGSCATTVTIVDQTLPSVSCPSTIISNVANGVSTAVVTYPSASVSDNCSLASSNYSPASGTTFSLGTNQVTRTAVDGSGNTNDCHFNVIVTQAPPEPHDLAVLSIKAPKKVTLKGGAPPTKPGKVTVTIQNKSDHVETIEELAMQLDLVTLTVTPLGTNCPAPLVASSPLKAYPAVLAPGKKLNLTYFVSITCAVDPLASSKTESHADYEYTASVNHAALDGRTDTTPANDVCPRAPTGDDPGCGNKDPVTKQPGADVLTDVIVK